MGSSNDIEKMFSKNGYVVIEDFLTVEETNRLKEAGVLLSKNADSVSPKFIFRQFNEEGYRYFLESADKIGYFFEADAFDKNNELKIPPELALNKIGHALHLIHPTFKEITFGEKVVNTCKKLGLVNPMVVQSMYIYKNPFIGGEVNIHQDGSYLYTEPMKLYGFWIALDDATEENGCLQIIPNSQTDEIQMRSVRNSDLDSKDLFINTGYVKSYPDSDFVSVPVKKGSCIILHGQVVHRSYPNKSSKSRHCYTFHLVDDFQCSYSKDNWIQTTFQHLY